MQLALAPAFAGAVGAHVPLVPPVPLVLQSRVRLPCCGAGRRWIELTATSGHWSDTGLFEVVA